MPVRGQKTQGPGKTRAALLGIVVMLLLSAGLVFLYVNVTGLVTETTVQSMDELMEHDKASLLKSIEYRWGLLEGVGEEVRHARLESIPELLEMLRVKLQGVEFENIGLVANTDKIYSGSLLVSYDKSISTVVRSTQGRFITRFVNPRSVNADSRRESLLMGVPIEPITVGGVVFDTVVGRLDLYALSSEFKIESYGGQGFSGIVDHEGHYIVSHRVSQNIREADNIYENFEGHRVYDGVTLEQFREAVENGREFTLRYSNAQGQDRVLRVSPLEGTDWSFVISLPMKVFRDQGSRIMTWVVAILALLILVAGAAVAMAMHSRSLQRRAELERGYTEELTSALHLAEQANRAKTVFLSNMSHDIRTPMNAIIGFTDLAIEHQGDPERVGDYLDKVSRSSRHLLSLINDVLDMSRIESGEIELNLAPCDIVDIIEDSVAIMATNANARRQHLSYNAEKLRDRYVLCDRLRVSQVVLNLLSNAVKFTPEGGSVWVESDQLEDDEQGRGTYILRVRDTGIGMSEEFKKTVFERFARERNSTVSGIEGTGLGMSITKRIVDLAGGTIDVESEPGVGTEFVVTVPFERCTQEEASKIAEAHGEGLVKAVDKTVRAVRRILLMEDNLLSRELAVELLEEAGYEVEAVENGREGVDLLCERGPGAFDVVLSDVQMPVMGGYEAARAIRALDDDRLSKIPIIALTANAFDEDVRESQAAGMNAHLAKPVNLDDLIEALDSLG